MNRAEKIQAILDHKERLISLDFDWPNNDQDLYKATEAELTEFLEEIEGFLRYKTFLGDA